MRICHNQRGYVSLRAVRLGVPLAVAALVGVALLSTRPTPIHAMARPVTVVPLAEFERPPVSDVSVIGKVFARLPNGARSELALESVAVEARIASGLASTSVDHLFVSAAPEITEGLYEVTTPKGSSVERYALSSEDGWLEGRFVERERARRIYESYVPQRRDPGLVEWQDGERFTARVFPIPAEGSKGVALGYTEPALATGGVLRWTLPLADALDGLERFSASIRIEVPGEGTDMVRVRRHPGAATIVRDGDEVVVAVSGSRPFADSIIIDVDRMTSGGPGAGGARLLVAPPREGEDEGYGIVLLDPSALGVGAETAAGSTGADFVFVVDRSGSMKADDRLGDATRQLRDALELLGPEDRFAVVAFSSAADQVTDGFLPADRRTGRALASNIRARGADGGTQYALALTATAGLLAGRDGDRPAMIVMLTDGQGFAEIAAEPGAPLFTVPIGTTDRHALDLSARTHGGHAVGSAAEAVKLAPHRALARLRPAVDEDEVRRCHPKAAAVFEPSREMLVAFRIAPGSDAPRWLAFEIEGPDGARRPVEVALDEAEPIASDRAARMWARARIEDLLGAPADNAKELARLGTDFRFVTPATSILVLESEAEYERWGLTDAPTTAADGAAPGAEHLARSMHRTPRIQAGAQASVEKPIIILEEEVEFTKDIPKGTDLSNLSNRSLDSTSVVDAYGVGGGAAGAYGQRWTWMTNPNAEVGPVDHALVWLAAEQGADGSWDAGDVEATSLSLLAFLGAGQTHRFGLHKRQVKRAVDWLRGRQDARGFLADSARGHALVTLALAEAYAVSRDFTLKRAVQAAVDVILGEPTPQRSLWRTLALRAAREGKLSIPDEAFAPPTGALAVGGDLCALAEGMYHRVLLDRARFADDIDRGRVALLATRSTERGLAALCHGSHALFQLGGADWDAWRVAVTARLAAAQRRAGDRRGGWWDADGCCAPSSRVVATALATLTLEAPYRYERAKD